MNRPSTRLRRRAAALLLGLSAVAPAVAQDPPPPALEAPVPHVAPAPFAPVMRTVGEAVINWTTLTIETRARSDRTMGAWMDRRAAGCPTMCIAAAWLLLRTSAARAGCPSYPRSLP